MEKVYMFIDTIHLQTIKYENRADYEPFQIPYALYLNINILHKIE